MKCSHCGKEIQEGMQFCTACGERIQKAEKNPIEAQKNEYRVVFTRTNKIAGFCNKLIVKIDGIEKLRLNNGESKEMYLPKGDHKVQICMMMIKPRMFTLKVDRERHINCYYSPVKTAMLNPILFTPIMAEDEAGNKL